MSNTSDGTLRTWDHEDCPIAGCDGELQQQDRFNVMCLDCETVWTHYTTEDEHILSRPDQQHEFSKPRVATDGGGRGDCLSLSDADSAVALEKEIGPPGDNMLSRFQEDLMYQIRNRLEEVGTPAKVRVTIEVDSLDE